MTCTKIEFITSNSVNNRICINKSDWTTFMVKMTCYVISISWRNKLSSWPHSSLNFLWWGSKWREGWLDGTWGRHETSNPGPTPPKFENCYPRGKFWWNFRTSLQGWVDCEGLWIARDTPHSWLLRLMDESSSSRELMRRWPLGSTRTWPWVSCGTSPGSGWSWAGNRSSVWWQVWPLTQFFSLSF